MSDNATVVDATVVQNKKAEPKPQIAAFLDKTIRHPVLKEAISAIQNTHAMSGYSGTGMLIMGEPGVGKTRILDHYVKEHLSKRDDLESETLSRRPILKVSIAKPTIIGVIRKMLIELGHPSIEGTQSKLEARLSACIKNQGVELIILDEFQHLLREQAQISTRNVLNFLKVLMDDHKLAIVMAGTPEGYRSIEMHEELYQRFTHEQIHIEPFDLASREEADHFRRYMNACQKILEELGVHTTPLTSDLMLQRMFLASSGKARLISKNIVKVLESTDLTQRVNLDDYAKAYARIRTNPTLGNFNPFAAPRDKVQEKLNL